LNFVHDVGAFFLFFTKQIGSGEHGSHFGFGPVFGFHRVDASGKLLFLLFVPVDLFF
jgi:hypothetical protein